jgi:hypothetical protein
MSILGMYNSVVIVTRYGLDGPGMKPRWGGRVRNSATVHTGSVVHPASCTLDTGSLFGDKTAGKWRLPPLHVAPNLKKE